MIFNYFTSFMLMVIGVAIIVSRRNFMKIIMGMSILDYGINLLLISIGFRVDGQVPIFINGVVSGEMFVDPIPQALTLTSIVIGACVTALALSLTIKIKEFYGTIDSKEVRRLKG